MNGMDVSFGVILARFQERARSYVCGCRNRRRGGDDRGHRAAAAGAGLRRRGRGPGKHANRRAS
jgi:hypothetical protein